MNCPQCNSPIEPTDRFCENCGSVLTSAKANPAPSLQSTDGDTVPPPPYMTAEAPGKHSREAVLPVDVPAAPAAVSAAAPAVIAATASATVNAASEAPVINDGPYASAVRMAATGSSSAQESSIPTATPVGAPVGYAQPQPFAQYDVASVPPSPYADSMETAPGTAFGLAITSLVIGLIGFLTFGIFGFFCVVGIVFAIIALVLRSGYKKNGLLDTHSGSTLALAISGLITSVLAVLLFVVILVFAVAIVEDETSDIAFDDTTIEQLIEDADDLGGLKA